MFPTLTSHCSLDLWKREGLLATLYSSSSSPPLNSLSAERKELSIWLERQCWVGPELWVGKDCLRKGTMLLCIHPILLPEAWRTLISCSLWVSSPSFRSVSPLLSSYNKHLLRRGVSKSPSFVWLFLDKWTWGWLHQPRHLIWQTLGYKLKSRSRVWGGLVRSRPLSPTQFLAMLCSGVFGAFPAINKTGILFPIVLWICIYGTSGGRRNNGI